MNRYRNRGSLAFVVVVSIVFVGLRTEGRIVAQNTKIAGSGGSAAETGKRNFRKYGCYECHGLEGQGSIVSGPRLGPHPIPLDAFTAYIRNPSGQMPPYTDKVLSDHQVAEIHAFLESLQPPPAVDSLPILK
jgi:ubiquinol-cytochrome c reductase cytochrome c subunit